MVPYSNFFVQLAFHKGLLISVAIKDNPSLSFSGRIPYSGEDVKDILGVMKKKHLILAGLAFLRVDADHVIHRIQVHGNQRVERQAIIDYFPKKVGAYSQQELDNILKTLFKTSLFEDVKLEVQGKTLNVWVRENQFLNQVAFEGNKDISEEDLKAVVTLKPPQVLTLSRVQEAKQAILSLYRAKGRYATHVQCQCIKRDFNRVDLIFNITEGPKAYIRDIFFVGNKVYSKNTLASIISSKEVRWYRFFGPPEEMYNPERIKYDEELLRQFYLKNGYVDVQIVSSQGELSLDDKYFVVTFNLEEGPRYCFGKTRFTSQLSHVNAQDLVEALEWKEGAWFDGKALQAACDRMTLTLSERGVPFVEVVPLTTKRDHWVDIQFVVKSTPAYYVDTITMRGNLGTDDQVIRRELLFAEGDPLSPTKISESEKKLQNLDFFETIEITDSPAAEDRRHLVVKVKEKSTGDIQFGGGYSSVDGPVARIGLEERNFLGMGNALHFSSYLAKRGWDMDLGTSIPHFMGYNFTFGTDITFSRYRGDTRGTFSHEGGYHQQVGGILVSANYLLRKNLYQGWTYRIRRERLDLRRSDMSPYLIQNISQHTQQWVSGVGHDLVYDRIEKRGGNPIGGWFSKLTNDWTGAGGNIHYLSNTVSLGSYLSLDEDSDYLLRMDARFGAIKKLGYMRFMDQYFLGGFTFPGFTEAGVGPRDRRTGDALGGRRYYTASAKLYFPLGLPKELPVKGVIYVQSGSLWSSIFKGPYVESNKFKNRLSVGGGVMWTLPFLGRIGLVLSKVLVKIKGNYPKGDHRQTPLFLWGKEF